MSSLPVWLLWCTPQGARLQARKDTVQVLHTLDAQRPLPFCTVWVVGSRIHSHSLASPSALSLSPFLLLVSAGSAATTAAKEQSVCARFHVRSNAHFAGDLQENEGNAKRQWDLVCGMALGAPIAASDVFVGVRLQSGVLAVAAIVQVLRLGDVAESGPRPDEQKVGQRENTAALAMLQSDCLSQRWLPQLALLHKEMCLCNWLHTIAIAERGRCLL